MNEDYTELENLAIARTYQIRTAATLIEILLNAVSESKKALERGDATTAKAILDSALNEVESGGWISKDLLGSEPSA